jgi:putative ABC transport system permease protein
MSRLFGAPVGSLAAVLAGVLMLVLGAVAVLALRNRVFFRLGVRNVRRRPARTALIVAGSMLGTAIIAAALTTGDTMSHTIRGAAVTALGQTDEVVAAKGIDTALAADGAATGDRYFPQGYADRIAQRMRPTGLVDGVAPVIVEPIAVLDVASRQSEPEVTLFASDPARLRDFGAMRSGGTTRSLADLGPGEVYLNAKAAEKLDAHAGDVVRVLAGRSTQTARVKAIVHYDGGGTDGAGLLMPLAPAQRLLGKPGLVRAVFVSNRGGGEGGAKLTDQVIRELRPTLTPLGLEADDTKRSALDDADTAGAAFMSMFTTFGSFSIAAGILLIFLIVVMLAAERRGELGIARAVGTRRRHLVQMFLFEGLAYDVIAAAAGALLGVGVAYLMVRGMAAAVTTGSDLKIAFAVKPASVVLAYALGVLLTLAVVTYSAWRVSRMNIVSAIRNLPEPAPEHRRKARWLAGIVAGVLGALLIASGAGAQNAITLGFGVLLVILGLVPIARALGAPDRLVYTSAGLALVVWFTLPIERWLFGDMKTDFSMFILAGLAIVVGASWAIMYNADLLLGAVSHSLGRIRGLAPTLKMSMAYPLRSRFRTGVTLAMFTLVVFTLVVGAITTGSFVQGFNNLDGFGGGFDVRTTTSPASPIPDLRSAIARSGRPGLDAANLSVVSDQSMLPVKARQVGTPRPAENYVAHGVDRAFLDHTTYRLAATARGYGSSAEVWRALGERPGLAVVDPFVVPRRSNYNFAPPPDFRLTGFELEDRTFAAPSVLVRDPQTGRQQRLKVIGVLSDTVPEMMGGIWTSQATLTRTFGDRVIPTVHLVALRDPSQAKPAAKALESAFLANGMQADSLQQLLDDAVGASLTFDRLIEGFMGLGLVVGVAALGVISARSVVERRQQIGVLRAIGFRRRMVQTSFLLESSFVALTSIVVGTVLGIAVAYNVVADAKRTPSWESMTFHVPWLALAVIFLLVYGVALATTLVPARRGSRVYPAEALRYE